MLHVNDDADSLVIHGHGGADPDLARRIFDPKYHDPVTSECTFTHPRDTYEPSARVRRPRDIALAPFSLAAGGALPRTVVRGLLASSAAVATLHFADA